MKQKGKDRRFLRPLHWRAFFHSQAALHLLLCAIGVILLTAIFVVAIVPVRYDLRVGTVPSVTIAATKDVVDEIATENRREMAANAVMPTYRYQEGVTEEVMAGFDAVFDELRKVMNYGDTLPNQSSSKKYSREELDYAHSLLTLLTLRDYQMTSLLHSTHEDLENAYMLLYTALQSTMQSHVTEGQESAAISSIIQIVSYRMSLALSQNVAPAVLSACVRPNMVIDQEATETAREAARQAVEPTIFKQGQNIVVRGEGRITANQLEMLSTLGLLSGGELDLSMYLGAALLVFVVMLIMLLLLRKPEYRIFDHARYIILLFLILAISLGLCVLARAINMYLAPIVLSAMLITALLGVKPGMIACAAVSILASALAAGGSEAYTEKMVILLLTGLLSGTVSALVVGQKPRKLRLLMAALIACLTDFAAVFAMGLMTSSELSGTVETGALRAAGSGIAVLFAIGLQPVLESLFNLPTATRLMELSNPNHPLLRRLLLEAPGTYHHSIIVANLAEAAAEAIDANPLLARVGGYYHDVGKLVRPGYFKENQLGNENVHDRTDPKVSAEILTAHTTDGVALARSYRLPQAVLDIIGEHHGDTPVMYFYHKALQLSDGKPVDINDFRYDSHPPRSKEGAIVLLCDTIEAAMRTLKNPTPEGIEEFIVKLVRGKLEDGQLSDSPLTLRDIDKICAAATTVLNGVFHERIEYPEMKENSQQRVIHNSAEEETRETLTKEIEAEQEKEAAVAEEATAEEDDSVPTQEAEGSIPLVQMEKPEAIFQVAPPPVEAPLTIEEAEELIAEETAAGKEAPDNADEAIDETPREAEDRE